MSSPAPQTPTQSPHAAVVPGAPQKTHTFERPQDGEGVRKELELGQHKTPKKVTTCEDAKLTPTGKGCLGL